MNWPERVSSVTGSQFYHKAVTMNWQQRDSFVIREVFSGNFPGFLKLFNAIHSSIIDSVTKKTIRATYFVAPDYISIGTGKDWARVCITPMAAQKIADTLNCFLPTKKMVDDIYKAATVKLEPVPMFSFRDSTLTMWQHHLIIEGQRKSRKGLIAGIKKDIVISRIVTSKEKNNRVAIYGWHKPDGKAIQPLYAGHVNWYVDYSHGARLVYRKIKVNNKWMDYTDVLKDPVLRRFICDETVCDYYNYTY